MSDSRREKTLWTIGLIVVVGAALLPVLWLVSLSLKQTPDLTDGNLFPRGVTFENYEGIFSSDAEFLSYLRNSIGIALIATFISIVLGAMAAYALARLDFPGKTLILSVALAIAMFPPISVVGPLYELWRNIGLFDTWQGLIIPYMTFTLPLAIYTLSAFFREIPWELEQAAQVDGATPAQAFRKVILPLAAPGVFTTAIIVFVGAWNEYLIAVTMTNKPSIQTAPVLISKFAGTSQFVSPFGSQMAAAVVVTIPLVILVLLFQRRIVAGLSSGAVK